MKNIFTRAIFTAALLFPAILYAQDAAVRWNVLPGSMQPGAPARLQPKIYTLLTTSDALLRNALAAAPEDVTSPVLISLPRPDGSLRTFRVWQTPVLEKALASKYPGILTLTAVADDDPSVSAKLDFTSRGFHAMIWSREGVYFIDPYNAAEAPGYYLSYYRRDYSRANGEYMHCEVGEDVSNGEDLLAMSDLPRNVYRLNGATRKQYRLALACTGEYAAAVDGPTPTKAGVLAAMVVSVNRVNGLYEREFAVTLQLIANTDTLISLNAATDGYTNNSGGTMLGENQTKVNLLIGAANYDIGHVFSTGGGGIAQLGCVCTGSKAQGVTGLSNPVGDAFDIDYVAHEMGHQFGGDHTFNSNLGSCGGNRANSSAYEPGSGTTIMAYAGICGNDNTQAHSDPFFHPRSLVQISTFITTGAGAGCPQQTPALNTPPALSPIKDSFNVPFLTPFELTAPAAVDADHDTLTYLWEQWNRGNFGAAVQQARQRFGPIFRSFIPTPDRTRVFPVITKLLANITNYKGEMLPDTARRLTFKLTCRDIKNGIGSWNFTDDSVVLNVIYTGTPFAVTAPNTALTLNAAQPYTITWDVSSTDVAPISAGTVDIYMSTDGGFTYPILVAAATPNDGTETVTMPNLNTPTARIKIKGTGNVFFDISNENFVLSGGVGIAAAPGLSDALQVYPVPAEDVLNVSSSARRPLSLQLINTLGQEVVTAVLNAGIATIPTGHLAPGVYYLKATEAGGKETLVKRVLIR